MKLYTLQYNNYYNNRIRNNGSMLSSYSTYIVNDPGYWTISNFNYGDGITTSQVIGTFENPVTTTQFDYCLLTDTQDSNEVVVHRYFVMECKYLRGEQYQLVLKRDVLSEFDYIVKSTPSKIKRGYVQDNDDLIFNPEEMSFNQIKKGQELLWDDTQTPWVVGYYDKGYCASESKTFNFTPSLVYDITETGGLESWDYKDYIGMDKRYKNYGRSKVNYILDYQYNCKKQLQVANRYMLGFTPSQISYGSGPFIARQTDTASTGEVEYVWHVIHSDDDIKSIFAHSSVSYDNWPLATEVQATKVGFNDWTWTDAEMALGKSVQDMLNNHIAGANAVKTALTNQLSLHDSDDYAALAALNDKLIYFEDDALGYKIVVHYGNTTQDFVSELALYTAVKNIIDGWDTETLGVCPITSMPSFSTSYGINKRLHGSITYDYIWLSLDPIGNLTDVSGVDAASFTFPSQLNRQDTQDSVYGTFAIPLDGWAWSDKTSVENVYNTRMIQRLYSLKLIDEIARDMGTTETGYLKDLQILPYGPFGDSSKYHKSAGGGIYHHGFVYGDFDARHIVWATSTNSGSLLSTIYRTCVIFPSSIECTGTLDYSGVGSTISDYKMEACCDTYRINSPNWSGSFEFNAARNGGIDGFNYAMTLKPSQPFIRVQPIFKRLYGLNFNDARGLVCGGDFSYATMSDAWIEYLNSNKNFQAAFNSEIQSLDALHQLTMEYNKKVGITNAIVSGAGGGAVAGAMIGGGVGAVIGSAVGVGASLYGLSEDLKYAENLYQEQRQLKQDLFDLNIGSIKAQPSVITNVGCQTAANPGVPILEYYSCSDVEKKMFKAMIRYTGMSVGIIGQVINYVNANSDEPTYVQATPIKIENINEDGHIAQVIAEEMSRGFYIGGNLNL